MLQYIQIFSKLSAFAENFPKLYSYITSLKGGDNI